ncbi:putative nucleotidyltransferase, ribonuclease H [Tanacetum coccineum]|uniref:Nucleotidyltransferase, ribonuclease H n=1 Tax=Tanacetum coccineum TaxID=301880 RepID=A0ABQ5AM34_9ASTR
MVKEGIVLGHKISKSGIKVDPAKIDVIAKLPYSTNVKGVRSFLGHAGFYRRFIKDFSKIARPMNQLLMKDAKFIFLNECMQAFNILKNKLTSAVIIDPDWNLDFELMCNASDYAVGAVLGQRIDKKFRPIYYARKTMNDAQEHYTTTEKELLAAVYAFDKFRSYLIMSKTVVYTDHSALKYLFSKQDTKPRLIRWVLLLQEFTIKIKDKKGTKNLAANHLYRLENLDLETLNEEAIWDSFPDEHLMVVQVRETTEDPWYADYTNFLVSKIIPHGLTYHLRKKFLSDIKHYIWDDPYLFKSCPDGIIRRCVFGKELQEILEHYYTGPTGGHYRADITARKVFESGFYWPTIFRDAIRYSVLEPRTGGTEPNRPKNQKISNSRTETGTGGSSSSFLFGSGPVLGSDLVLWFFCSSLLLGRPLLVQNICRSSDPTVCARQRSSRHPHSLPYWTHRGTLRVKEKFCNLMKCLKIPSEFEKSLTRGALISWDRSRLSQIFEASRAHGFVLRSQELHILSFIWEIQYPNLID